MQGNEIGGIRDEHAHIVRAYFRLATLSGDFFRSLVSAGEVKFQPTASASLRTERGSNEATCNGQQFDFFSVLRPSGVALSARVPTGGPAPQAKESEEL